MTPIRAPFPWHGGKRRVAPEVWEAFGNPPNYVEPFAGSLAVLLGRPGGAGKIETVNDLDGHLVNFWRSVQLRPDETARAADWPVAELDLHARHTYLVERIPELREKLRADPHYCDPELAGWWVWGICCWIGGGWCAEPNNHKRPQLDGIGKGVHSQAGQRDRTASGTSHWRKRPQMDGLHPGTGVHRAPEAMPAQNNWHLRRTPTSESRRRPHLADAGIGVHRLPQQLPMLSVTADGCSTGRGVHSGRLPSLGNDRGIHGVSSPPCTAWFRQLQDRLRRVRIACGDWTRVLGPSVLGKGKNVGGRRPAAVFLDPPYDTTMRDPGLYAEDEAGLSAAVREWAIEHGDDPDLRIALCGYEGEHDMPTSWRVHAWRGARGYASDDNTNRERERVWFSPHCLQPRQADLFTT